MRCLAKSVVAMAIVATGPLRAQPTPPCRGAEYRQFDFWLGSWQVVDSTGRELGRNRIERILNGCVLLESWTGAGGSHGRSHNIYDLTTGRWHQTWVDDQGTVLQLDGSLVGGRMILEGTQRGANGRPVRHRITYTPLAGTRVRQQWDRSTDGGRRWVPVFDGTYRPALP